MDRQDEIKLIWWNVIEAAQIFEKMGENDPYDPLSPMKERIFEFQYRLWEICGSPMENRPK